MTFEATGSNRVFTLFSVKMSNRLKCRTHLYIPYFNKPRKCFSWYAFFPDILFIYNSEPPCLQLDANNNEWMILFAFLVLNLYVKIKIVLGFLMNFSKYFMFYFHMLILDVFVFVFRQLGWPACLPHGLCPFFPLSLTPFLPLQESLQVKKVMIFSPLYNFPPSSQLGHFLESLCNSSMLQDCFILIIWYMYKANSPSLTLGLNIVDPSE